MTTPVAKTFSAADSMFVYDTLALLDYHGVLSDEFNEASTKFRQAIFHEALRLSCEEGREREVISELVFLEGMKKVCRREGVKHAEE